MGLVTILKKMHEETQETEDRVLLGAHSECFPLKSLGKQLRTASQMGVVKLI